MYYLYEQDFDVSAEADTKVVDDMGTDATSDDEEVEQPYANAISSAVSDDTLTAVFLGIPFGTYDLYTEDASSDVLSLVQEDIVVSDQ